MYTHACGHACACHRAIHAHAAIMHAPPLPAHVHQKHGTAPWMPQPSHMNCTCLHQFWARASRKQRIYGPILQLSHTWPVSLYHAAPSTCIHVRVLTHTCTRTRTQTHAQIHAHMQTCTHLRTRLHVLCARTCALSHEAMQLEMNRCTKSGGRATAVDRRLTTSMLCKLMQVRASTDRYACRAERPVATV